MTAVLAVLALVAVLAAVGSFLSARGAREARRVAEEALARAQSEGEAAARDASEARAELKERREEAAALRDQVREARRRAFEQQEVQRKAGPVAALREELEKVTARLGEARAEGAAAADRARSLEGQVEKLSREAERERAARKQLEAAPPPPVAPPPPPPAAGPDEGLLKAEKERADKAESKLAEARKKVGDLERELKTARGRLETDRRVYVVQKGELDLAHDRYAELRRRHDALRKEHDDLIEAVRQAAREERRQGEKPGEGAPSPAAPGGD